MQTYPHGSSQETQTLKTTISGAAYVSTREVFIFQTLRLLISMSSGCGCSGCIWLVDVCFIHKTTCMPVQSHPVLYERVREET